MIARTNWKLKQKKVCIRFGAEFSPCAPDSKLGVDPNVRTDMEPVTGIRHLPCRGTNGWYIWAGEGDPTLQDEHFYKPLHVEHMPEWCPAAVPYLGLPPGWGFIIADGYEDVWFDETYLKE